jgi:hypothetical protein
MNSDYTGKDLIIATGAPGSQWSGQLRILTSNININRSDETEARLYDHIAIHPKTGKPVARGWHRGAYWGPDHELGHTFDRLDLMSKEQVITEFKKAFSNWEPGVKIIKSHWFAYHLPLLKEMFPDAKFIAVYRTNEECFDWWHVCGGWDISYPHYTWYKDDNGMRTQIAIENKHILDFFKDLKKFTLDELFLELGLRLDTLTLEEFLELDPKLYDVFKTIWRSNTGDYKLALNTIIGRNLMGIC